jgi:hypothetical protein
MVDFNEEVGMELVDNFETTFNEEVTEQGVEDFLVTLFNSAERFRGDISARSFEEAQVLTMDKGVVVTVGNTRVFITVQTQPL